MSRKWSRVRFGDHLGVGKITAPSSRKGYSGSTDTWHHSLIMGELFLGPESSHASFCLSSRYALWTGSDSTVVEINLTSIKVCKVECYIG